MNPLIPTNALQIRYVSPIFEPIFDDGEIIDEECVRNGTNVLRECIVAVNKDKLPRYYRLRYRENAKDHKRRWERWLEDNLIHGLTPYFIKVKKIGKRVLFEFDASLVEKREKKLRAIQHKKDMKARKLARQVAAEGMVPQDNESWDEWLVKLETDSDMQGIIASTRAFSRETIPQPRPIECEEDDDDEVVIIEGWEDNPDRYIGESEQGEAVYEDRESGDRYEER